MHVGHYIYVHRVLFIDTVRAMRFLAPQRPGSRSGDSAGNRSAASRIRVSARMDTLMGFTTMALSVVGVPQRRFPASHRRSRLQTRITWMRRAERGGLFQKVYLRWVLGWVRMAGLTS